MFQYHHLQVNTLNGVVVVRFLDEWLTNDLSKRGLGNELLCLITQQHCSKLLLNFAGVTYVSSAFLGKLMSLHKQVKTNVGQLKLCEVPPTVQQIFALMKLNEILDIRNTESEGSRSFE